MADYEGVDVDEITDEGRLRMALVGTDANRLRLYRQSALFKSAVDTLAGMLPLMVDGLASSAERDQAAFDERLALIERGTLRFGERP